MCLLHLCLAVLPGETVVRSTTDGEDARLNVEICFGCQASTGTGPSRGKIGIAVARQFALLDSIVALHTRSRAKGNMLLSSPEPMLLQP